MYGTGYRYVSQDVSAPVGIHSGTDTVSNGTHFNTSVADLDNL
jgi:hypothetical protein